MEKLHGNMLSCLNFTWKHKNMHIFMYFLTLVPPFAPSHHIIMVKLMCLLEYRNIIRNLVFQEYK